MASGQLPEFVRNDQWPQFRLNHVLPCLGAMWKAYHKLHPKPISITKFKDALQVIWDSLPQEPINKAVKSFSR